MYQILTPRAGLVPALQQTSFAGVNLASGRVRRNRVMETVHLHDLRTERLEPGQQSVQGGLIPEGAVQDRLDRLHRGAEPLEVKQGFGREDPDDPNLVVGRRHRSPPDCRDGQG
jgi:hypothetical protein